MWIKGCLHLHTTCSDGELTPTRIYDSYKDKGYDFIAITDHNVITNTDKKPEKNFLVIENSIEFHLTGSYLHVLGINLKSDKIEKFKDHQQIIDFILKNDGIAIIAHPNWMWVPKFNEISRLKNFHGIEIFNSAVKEPPINAYVGSSFALEKWDYLLSQGYKIWGFAADDLHIPKEHLIFNGWIMVNVKTLTKKDIVDSIKKGNFYCSTGVMLKDCYRDKNSYYVNSDNGEEVVFIGENGKIIKVIDGKKGKIEINKKYKYIRCEVRSTEGIAYTQPVFGDSGEI